ncbi:MAG: hypothetical protein EOO61_22305 [Hymenobacter sp.]|nr:MAG: hypothetical protein EOO61_22305 [Hymenobacter sp.]
MKTVLIALTLMASAGSTHAQFKNLLNKAKEKVQQRADTKVDKAMDKTLDDLEGKKKESTSAATTTPDTKATESSSAKPEAAPQYKVLL